MQISSPFGGPETRILTILPQKFGSAASIEAAVRLFYRRIPVDDRAADIDADVDQEGQIAARRGFSTMAPVSPHARTG